VDGAKRKPGRPRKWSSDAERMRAHRARERERAARLVDPADAPDALAENRELRERVAQLEDERDRLLCADRPTSARTSSSCDGATDVRASLRWPAE
jgi:hypothetical protein